MRTLGPDLESAFATRKRCGGGAAPLLRWAFGSLLSWLVAGCSGAATPGPQAAAIASARVQSQRSPDRPRLTLVEREGDPERGVALAVHLATPPVSALALSSLIEGRLRSAGFAATTAHASPSGFLIYTLVDRAERVTAFIQEANRALITPVTPAEAQRVAAKITAEPPRRANSPSEAAVAQCSGEFLLEPGAPEPGPLAATSLEAWLDTVGVRDVALAVVGSRDHLRAANAALAELAPWARQGGAGGRPAPTDAVGLTPASGGKYALSVALSGVAPAVAIASAERVGEADSLLSVRLSAGFPAWQIARVSTNLDGGSACLRLDLQASGATPTAEAVANSAWNAIDELQQTLARLEPGPWVIAKQVLQTEAPEEAAAVAAWQALNDSPADGRPGSLHRLIHYAGELSPSAPAERLAQLFGAASASTGSAIEVTRGTEPGQGSFWMLLATPCGTSAEDAATAGTLALALHGTASAFNGRDGVTLEPWLSVDSMGILAHSAASASHERSEAQAERVAEALARAVLSAGPPAESIAGSREMLLGSLADGPTPGLSLALRQASANHPSWLDARGTWATLSAISTRSVQLERASFLRGKLRLATLGTQDESQVAAGEQRLLQLLRAADAGRGSCVARRTSVPAPGQYRIEASGARDSDAIIAVPLPPHPEGLSEEALWTEILMNRADGWLAQALLQPGLVSTARARALGGAGAAALVIELHALDGKRDQAVAQVRGLLEHLRAGAATAADAKNAGEVLTRRRADRRLNPRARIVDLWQHEPSTGHAAATLETLRRLHQEAFAAGREVVVLTDPPPD